MPGTFKPVRNPYSWTDLTNMLSVEQPIGVDFNQQTPDIADEAGLAKESVGFYESWLDVI